MSKAASAPSMAPDVSNGSGVNRDFVYLVILAALTIVGWSEILQAWLPFDFSFIPAVLGLLPLGRDAYYSLRSKSVSVPVFMSIAIVASISVGEFLSAAVVAFFALLAEGLEEFTTGRSRRAISYLVRLAPKTARVIREGAEVEVTLDQVKVGETVVVRSGERIPVDGLVINGEASVNEAPITGESVPVDKTTGDKVFAGSVSSVGALEIRTSRVGEETTLGRIIRQVEEAQESKAPVQRIADRFTTYFTPVVLAAAALTYAVTRDLTNSITVLIVSCPCSVALATPLAVVAGIGKASKRGILIKGGVHLETLGKVDTVGLDKTGTLTFGAPRITDVIGLDQHDEKEVVEMAAMTERHSEHPFAKAIMDRAKELQIKIPEHRSCKILRGRGVTCEYGEGVVLMGNRRLMEERGIRIGEKTEQLIREKEEEGKTALIIAHNDQICGVLCVADKERDESREAIRRLKRDGLKLIMLTGDNPRTAHAIARRIGVDEVVSEALPEDKVRRVRELMAEGRTLAMVGDGINDAPALAQANVGIAMGAAGTDIAIEAADVALMSGDLTRIQEAISLGKKTFRTIKINLAAGVIFNVVGVLAAASGLLNPITAAMAHIMPDLLVFLNSSRLLR
jgi:heavy metal translocating P-type ATPase